MTKLQEAIQSVPRTVVRTYFGAARIPLGVAESILRRGDRTEEWGPALAFDAAEANVKQVIGSLVGDEALETEGRLAQARVSQLRRAVELEAEAERKKAEAEAEFRQRQQADERRLDRIETQAEEREAALEREKAQAKREAEAKARQQAEAARKAEAAQEKALERQERAARAKSVTAEQQALADERRAAEATEEVLDLDRALRTTKAARKSK